MIWDFAPEIFSIDIGGFHFAPRWYGLCFAAGILSGFYLMRKYYREAGYSEEVLNSGFVLFVIGTIVGARLGHCLFYEPEYYLSKPWKMLAIWEGGLASHGGTIGIFIAMVYYTQKYNVPFIWLADRLGLAIALGVPFIRLGNFFNSEIVGHPTDVPWGVIFKRTYTDDVPRHPAQLYEALAYILIFIGLYLYDKWGKGKLAPGKIIGAMFVGIFTARFFIEFVKENQVGFEDELALNMGQLLSIPMVALGLFFFFGGYQKYIQKPVAQTMGSKKKR